MKLNAEYMRAAIQVIMDEAGVSPEEIANAAGLNRTAIYKILNGNTSAVRRSTIRQIADGLKYSFKIIGDRVTFTKLTEEKKARYSRALSASESALSIQLVTVRPSAAAALRTSAINSGRSARCICAVLMRLSLIHVPPVLRAHYGPIHFRALAVRHNDGSGAVPISGPAHGLFKASRSVWILGDRLADPIGSLTPCGDNFNFSHIPS
jgi:predicted transcriptional regulator